MLLRRLLTRGPLLVGYALMLTLLIWRSSLLSLLPLDLSPLRDGAWILLAFLVLLAPALATPRSPLPAMLAVLVPTVVVASYDQSHLDWLRTLKQFDVVDPGLPDVPRVLLAATAALVAWAAHAADMASRLHERLRARGVPEAEAKKAARHSGIRSGLAALTAVGGASLVFALAFAARQVDLPPGRVTFLMPLVAAGLVAFAAILLATRDRRAADAEADEPPAHDGA